MNVKLRYAAPEDAPQINAIYDYYIENTVVTFNERGKTDERRASDIEATLAYYPYIVAESGGRIVGFACAEPVRPQSGYRYSAELTIYLAPDAPKRSGIGGQLYALLLPMLAAQGYRTVYAVIGGENAASLAFHTAQGFKTIARFEKSGYKQGRWLDAVWMQKALGSYDDAPAPIIPFRELSNREDYL